VILDKVAYIFGASFEGGDLERRAQNGHSGLKEHGPMCKNARYIGFGEVAEWLKAAVC
jgi:hypothetical protein